MHRLQELRGESGEEDPHALGRRGGSEGAAADGGQDQALLADLGPAHADDARHIQRRREVTELSSCQTARAENIWNNINMLTVRGFHLVCLSNLLQGLQCFSPPTIRLLQALIQQANHTLK